MTYTLGVLTFVIGLLVSVMLHELGHFATAKRFGMKATRFFVGFGPTIWSTRRGETEYGVKAIPAGGFVKIVGMTPLEDVDPGDEDRVFYKQPTGRRVIVLAAGSVMHFVIAILVLFGVILATHEDPISVVYRVQGIQPCLSAKSSPSCPPNAPKPPAAGKLRPGDQLLTVNGKPVGDDGSGLAIVQRNAGRPVRFGIIRAGRHLTVTVVPAPLRVAGKVIGRVGIQNEAHAKHVSAAAALPRTFGVLGEFTTSTVSALGDIPHELSQIVHSQQRGANGPASVVDIARVSGQIATAHVSVGARLAELLLIVAQVNFFVGLFNLLPLLPLDGGHIAIALFESGRRRVYALAGRADPGRVDLLKIMPVTYAVVAAFIGLSLLLIYAGIVNPIRIQ
jgi:membrane-associated protease RseP (regulator of RpoE activity)